MMRARRHRLLVLAVAMVALIVALWAMHQRDIDRRMLLMRSDPDTILDDPRPRAVALAIGARVYAAHCAACHGDRATGDPRRAMPDLTDDDFLYGNGKTSEIEQIVLHGIRSPDRKGWNLASMPGFAQLKPYAAEPLPALTPAQIADLIAFLRAGGGNGDYDPAAMARGRTLFGREAGCWDCHGSDGRGDSAIGAPNLLDGKWLKGDGSEADIRYTLERGLAGVSPAFVSILSPFEARAVAAYVASLHPKQKEVPHDGPAR